MSSLAELKKATSYREFLRSYLDFKEIPVAQFSRSAKFSSRGYPAEILSGRRRLSAKALPRVLQAIQLPSQWKLFFHYLVALEEPDVLSSSLSSVEIRARIEGLRKKLGIGPIRSQSVRDKKSADELFQIRSLLPIFASLGDAEKGATLDEVLVRTALPVQCVKESLSKMATLGLIREGEDPARYIPVSTHLSMKGMGESVNFQNCFLEGLERIRLGATSRFNSRSELFLNSAFTVNAEDLPQVKEELREVILKYIDGRINPEGNQTVEISLGLVAPQRVRG